MTAHKTPNDLLSDLSAEMDSMTSENAERLCNILRGLFSCMQDLNTRVSVLESQCARAGKGEN